MNSMFLRLIDEQRNYNFCACIGHNKWDTLMWHEAKLLLGYPTVPASQQTIWKLAIIDKLHLQLFSRYCAVSVLGSRVWPFGATWRHRSCDHLIIHRPFPLEPSLYLLAVSETFNGECDAMVGMTLIRPVNKVQSISHIRLPIGCQW